MEKTQRQKGLDVTDSVSIKTTQALRILVCGSERFAEQKQEVCDFLTKIGHKPIEACNYYQEHGGGKEGDRAVEIILTPYLDSQDRDPQVDALLVITDESGYCGVITTIRIGFASARGIQVYSIGKLKDPDYENYVIATESKKQFISLAEEDNRFLR